MNERLVNERRSGILPSRSSLFMSQKPHVVPACVVHTCLPSEAFMLPIKQNPFTEQDGGREATPEQSRHGGREDYVWHSLCTRIFPRPSLEQLEVSSRSGLLQPANTRSTASHTFEKKTTKMGKSYKRKHLQREGHVKKRPFQEFCCFRIPASRLPHTSCPSAEYRQFSAMRQFSYQAAVQFPSDSSAQVSSEQLSSQATVQFPSDSSVLKQQLSSQATVKFSSKQQFSSQATVQLSSQANSSVPKRQLSSQANSSVPKRQLSYQATVKFPSDSSAQFSRNCSVPKRQFSSVLKRTAQFPSDSSAQFSSNSSVPKRPFSSVLKQQFSSQNVS